ncbi:unnamed protein product [Tetraodon nigroviridis]|uniref:(spotted green pufferfish) hypothetical protein n=1 Tax=Tetraodon nigroviridis TaxID=99883 RepID=Q4RSH7_TETNG|nr:unnamed protein product [Tetraodon nigroviridis]
MQHPRHVLKEMRADPLIRFSPRSSGLPLPIVPDEVQLLQRGHADRRLPCRCFYSVKKVQTRCEELFRVIVALTGEWAIKPRGCRFMDHLVLSKVKGQGCTTCSPQYSTVQGGP